MSENYNITYDGREKVPLGVSSEGPEKIMISSDLVSAYLVSMLKSVLFIGALAAVYFLTKRIIGYDPFADAIAAVGIPSGWVLYGIIGVIAAYFIITILAVTGLASARLVFEGDFLTYSSGFLMPKKKSTKIVNIVKINFKEYAPIRTGELELELTGTDDKKISIRYVRRAKENCELINHLVSFKKSQQFDALRDADNNAGQA